MPRTRWTRVLLWSVIAAAFVGPGTVTAAAASGARFGSSLLWALTFSSLACFVLQEASARLTIVTGRSLGSHRTERGDRHWAAPLTALTLMLGCAAYQAGNILGGASGASLGWEVSPRATTVAIGIATASLLFLGRSGAVARCLGLLVAAMGVAFVWTALQLSPSLPTLLRDASIPTLPDGSGLSILALVGTTIVPYNLFLGSGLAHGHTLREMRLGLALSIGLGVAISMAIVLVGTAVESPFSLEGLADVLAAQFGEGARRAFGVGLFAAGASSAITAPLAAAIAARALLGHERDPRWSDGGLYYRAIWGGVLGVGLAFGLAQARPVPVILVAQALNGLLLPAATLYLLLAVNDARRMGRERLNSPTANLLMGAVAFVTLNLGLAGLFGSAAALLSPGLLDERLLLGGSTGLSLILALPLARTLRRRRLG